ncbi:unnamed protein product, partial [Lampetra planeri]
CHDGIYSYSCLCESGWAGVRCETNIDDCASAPCLNGGSCVDLVDKYACFCPDGYTGKSCENDVDVCKQAAFNTSLCFNGATCIDGEGSNFTCSCPPGFEGDFCEVDVNECFSAPCLNAAICQDVINSYVCHCRSGKSLRHCLPQPCIHGICVENDPGYGYTCFCHPGFVVRLPTFSSYIHYFGNSYQEFEGTDLWPINNITVRFQTQVANGTIMYVDQGPANGDFFFMKLFVLDGILQFSFCCNEDEEVTWISTLIHVNDGEVHIVNIRYVLFLLQHLTPCEAEVTLSGHGSVKSAASNYWLGHLIQRTNHIFIGGLPQRYLPNQKAKPFHNYSGCIEVVELNERRSFYMSDALGSSNIQQCSLARHSTTDSTIATAPAPTPKPELPLHPLCRDGLCRNGGTCHQQPGDAPSCHCPLHFTGTFCEK